MERVRGRYILALDADEFLHEAGRSRLCAWLQRWVRKSPEPTLPKAAQGPGFSVLVQDKDAEGRSGRSARVVRLASAGRALGCWKEVAKQSWPGPRADWHPELLVDRGLAVTRMGERWPGEIAWRFHLALRSLVRPLFPAGDFGVMRAEALLGLGSYWHGPGDLPALGLTILRADLAEGQGAPIVSDNALAALYCAHGACLPQNSMA